MIYVFGCSGNQYGVLTENGTRVEEYSILAGSNPAHPTNKKTLI